MTRSDTGKISLRAAFLIIHLNMIFLLKQSMQQLQYLTNYDGKDLNTVFVVVIIGYLLSQSNQVGLAINVINISHSHTKKAAIKGK